MQGVTIFMEISTIVKKLENEAANTRFSFLLRVCGEFFGEPRINGSHHIFKTPWPGDPRLNLQMSKGKAKPYQVRQVIAALARLEGVRDGDDSER